MLSRTFRQAVAIAPRNQMRCMSTAKTFNKTEFRKPDPSKPRLVLAYSGGLDTSCQLAYLTKEKGYEVCAFIADLGQDDVMTDEDKEIIKQKAAASGAYSFYCEDMRKEFVEDFVYPMISASAKYESRYLFGTSIARPCIGKRQVEICWEEDAQHISHGSTGKGNDQVRFELCYLGMDPKLKCVTLWREPEYCSKFEGRQDLLDYAEKAGIPVSQTKKHSYSEDENSLHISYESGELEDPAYPGSTGEEYPGLVLKKKTKDLLDTPDAPANLIIGFTKGIPTKIQNTDTGFVSEDKLEIFEYLNTLAGEHGVGRIDIVENRYVGMKSRGCYETPAGTVLFSAHADLEVLTIDREVMRIRDSLAVKYAELLYNGYWFSPEMAYLKQMMSVAQESVTGETFVQLHKGHVLNRGRQAPGETLYNMDLVSMDSHGGFDPTAATGFINTLSTRLKAAKVRDAAQGREW